MRLENMGPSEGAVFPYDESTGGVGGALICGPTAPVTATGAAGSGTGVLIYLDGDKHTVDSMLQRAVAAGGRIAMPRTALPPGLGFIASIFDLDGNKIGLAFSKLKYSNEHFISSKLDSRSQRRPCSQRARRDDPWLHAGRSWQAGTSQTDTTG